MKYLLLLFPLLFLVSCSDETLSLFFDIPVPTEQERAEAAKKEAAQKEAEKKEEAKKEGAPEAEGAPAAAGETAREELEIEKVKTWEEAEALLPKDREGKKGRVDLTAAERQGIIKPRDSIKGERPPDTFVFRYDFFIPTEDPADTAYFPHSTHTKWVACQSCHPKIFPLRINKYTKKEIKKGKYCGVCHTRKGGATFWIKACDRCHIGPPEGMKKAEKKKDAKKGKKKGKKKVKKKSKKKDKKKPKKKSKKESKKEPEKKGKKGADETGDKPADDAGKAKDDSDKEGAEGTGAQGENAAGDGGKKAAEDGAQKENGE